MKSNQVHDNPSDVTAENDVVIMDGPGALAVTLTSAAAEQTGRRLCAAAAAALLQGLNPETQAVTGAESKTDEQ